jgi:mycothiol synthase
VWDEEKGTTRVRLLAYLGDTAVGVAIGSIQTREAFLDLIAVTPDARRQGVGKQLLRAWEREAIAEGADLLKVGENLHAYAWPGVDIRYTPAISFFGGAGYERTKVVYNMDLQLHADLAPTERQLARIATAGIVVRRAEVSDKVALSEHVGSLWNPTWERETLLGLDKNPPTVFLALRGETIVGFAAHGVYRPSLYGPIATDPAEQGHGIGDVLSRLCLVDMAVNGVATCQIGWVAEDAIPFYSRTVGARLGRCLWMFQKTAASAQLDR